MITLLKVFEPFDLDAAQITALSRLWMSVWPSDESTLEDYIARFHRRTRERPNRCLHVLFEDSAAVAVAETFSRIVHSEEGSFTVMALAAVCTDPFRRRQGFGRLVTLSAFERVHRGEFPFALFQTTIPEFYLPLGSRLITNSFWNSQNSRHPEANPFWDPYIMIHPGDTSWPEGPIDLNGQGY